METDKKCLITQHLIESIRWYMEAPQSIIKAERGGDGKTTWKQKAWKDLNRMLSREPSTFGVDAQNGMNFEKKVYEFANKDNRVGSAHFQEVCNSVKGMQFYKKEGKEFLVNDLKCYIHCKYDAILLPKLVDLKTTKTYKKGKYLNSVQHKLYCFVSSGSEFEYVVTEWEEYPIIKAVHREKYIVENRQLLETEVNMMVADCLDNLINLDLWGLYRDVYCLY